MTELTHEELTRILDYNPDTGVFTWKVGRNKGKKAGTKTRSGNVIDITGDKFIARNLAYFYVNKKYPYRGCYNINGDIYDNSIKNIEQYPEEPKELTQEYLKKLFYYNPETGEFKRKIPFSFSKVGDDGFCITRQGNYSYCQTRIGRIYQTNRIIFLYMTGYFPSPKKDVITIDNNSLNLKWDNLLIVDKGINSTKRGVYNNNKLGMKGVVKLGRKYRSEIRVNKRSIYLGLFTTAKEAHEAYLKAAKKYFGDIHNDGFNHTIHHLEYEEVEVIPEEIVENPAPVEEAELLEHEVDF